MGEVDVAIVSEITKMHENVVFAKLPFELSEPKGEFVIVVGNKTDVKVKPSENEILAELKSMLKIMDKADAIKLIKEKYNLTKSYVYNLYEKNK